MVQYRDIIQKQQNRLDKKQDKRDFVKAVITDALGNTTGAGTVWADRNTRRVWIQEGGSASLSQVPCYRISPVIGLGVIVGFEPYSTVREVLATDREFLGQTNPTGTSYEAPDHEDMLPGGRLQLWLDPRLITPLATFPHDSASLSVNIIAGDYPYAGTRKSFAGQVDYSIASHQPAGPNEHCLVGLYLDSSNNLQAVAGSTVSTALDAPEPIWPAGAFRLSVIDLDDTQTSLSLADDIQDRRLPWSDQQTAPVDAQYLTLAANSVLTQERVFTPSAPLSGVDGGAGNPYTLSVGAASESASGVAEIATQAETDAGVDDTRIVTPLKLANWSGAGGGGWPGAGKAMINSTEYDTVQLAIDAMSSGDIIKVGQGTDSGGIVPDTTGAIVGLSPAETIITRSDDTTITVSNTAAANLTLKNLTVSHTGAGVSDVCIQSNQDGLVLDNLNITKVSGAPTNSTGVAIYGGNSVGTLIHNCKISVTAGTNKYGVATATAASLVVIEGGEINAATADIYIGHASSVVELRGVKLLGGGIVNAAAGTVKGWYINSDGSIWVCTGNNTFSPIKTPPTNLLYHSLSHNLWQEGASRTDVADDTYVADLWNLLHNASTPNRPDAAMQSVGAGDTARAWGRFTVKQNTTQLAIVQLLQAADTYPLRGKSVSLSFEARGSNIANLRAAVICWASTADTLTSDVVGTWATGNLTLATNWSYANTPGSSIAITSSFGTYKVENISIPATANNVAVLIWTPDNENNGDYFEIRNVQLEPGIASTSFVARPFSSEAAGVYHFVTPVKLLLAGYLPCVRAGTTDVVAYGVLPTPMRKPPILTNASDLSTTLGTGAKQVDIVNLVTTSFVTATGNVTMSLSAGIDSYALVFTAATSFSGTAGSFCRVHHNANDLISTFDARLR